MQVTCVGIKPTAALRDKGRPCLTPELLAACGARYSRNGEGLQSIVERIDPDNEDKSVDSIFRMIDYGHQSIADMVPVAMFMDGVSQWLALHCWTNCPTAGGQESSTRYIEIGADKMLAPELAGIPAGEAPRWRQLQANCFAAYQQALADWTAIAEADPRRLRIPADLLASTERKDQRKVERLRRNYAFDRARYFLPLASLTNVMMIMSARGWVQLIQRLASHPSPEANLLAGKLRDGLDEVAPRLSRHAVAQDSICRGLADEFARMQATAAGLDPHLLIAPRQGEAALEAFPPPGVSGQDLADALRHHEHRYAYIGSALRRTSVRFSWQGLAIGDLRDFNRHRTGYKHYTLAPTGAYFADDQREALRPGNTALAPLLDSLAEQCQRGAEAVLAGHERLAQGGTDFAYWLPLGSQCAYEHTTTADHFIYQAELRTGLGAHYSYAARMRETLALWQERFPETASLINEGTAEPE